VILSKVAPEEHAAALFRLGIIGNQAKTPFTLVAEDLESRHEIADSILERFRRHNDCDATILGPFNASSLFKVRQEHFANPRRYAGGVGEHPSGRGAILIRPGGQRGLKPLQMPHAWATLRLEVFVDFKVSWVEQKNTLRRAAIATRTTDFLNILLQ